WRRLPGPGSRRAGGHVPAPRERPFPARRRRPDRQARRRGECRSARSDRPRAPSAPREPGAGARMKPPRTELGRTALRPASALWGLVSGARNALYDRRWARVHRLAVPVISIGNITTGGTGKTPLVIHLARLLLRAGAAPLVLSRGYRSKGTGTRTVSDG